MKGVLDKILMIVKTGQGNPGEGGQEISRVNPHPHLNPGYLWFNQDSALNEKYFMKLALIPEMGGTY